MATQGIFKKLQIEQLGLMDCETRSRTLNCIFRAERKKFRFFFVCIILISIFVKQLTI